MAVRQPRLHNAGVTAKTTLNPPPASTALPVILLTGFDAFGGDTLNPSWLAVQALKGEIITGHAVIAAQLPTEFAASAKKLVSLLRQHQPVLVIAVGQAGGRNALSLERVAINIQDARIPDNAGAQPIDLPVNRRGPAAYFSTLPIKAMQQAIEAEGVPAEISQTAGTFVCNHVFYALMHHLHTSTNASTPSTKLTRGGFIHVPYLPAQGTPHMALADIVRGLRAACACALSTHNDVARGAGAIS